MPLFDVHDRPLRNLRLSVTDRCNIRCAYCMPELDYVWLPRQDVLSFEEITRLVGVFTQVGVDRIRLTGGEPLLRKDLPHLVESLAARPSVRDLAMTTNGVLLARHADQLASAGLHRVTVSLDTLRRDRFQRLARFDELPAVLAGIDAAQRAFGTLKLDSVILKGVNDDEIVNLLEFARSHNAEVRFIEYMDVGGANRWSWDQVVTGKEMLATLAERYGQIVPVDEDSSAPATRYRLPEGTVFGLITSTTHPFCADCDRARLTADGHWFLCLYASQGLDLRGPLRAGASDTDLVELLTQGWTRRSDRGAEARLRLVDRTAQVLERADVHRQMHTRGG